MAFLSHGDENKFLQCIRAVHDQLNPAMFSAVKLPASSTTAQYGGVRVFVTSDSGAVISRVKAGLADFVASGTGRSAGGDGSDIIGSVVWTVVTSEGSPCHVSAATETSKEFLNEQHQAITTSSTTTSTFTSTATAGTGAGGGAAGDDNSGASGVSKVTREGVIKAYSDFFALGN
jgi:hypothetical protein